jgi:hypothetical protein
MSNELRMPFAEWLYRMAERRLEPAGRTIAIYSACFDISGNNQLCEFTGISPRTLDFWKKKLLELGWVIIPAQPGGRGNGIKVFPALDGAPVSFTNITPANPRKFCPPSVYERVAEITPVISANPRRKSPPIHDKTHADVAPHYDRNPRRSCYPLRACARRRKL